MLYFYINSTQSVLKDVFIHYGYKNKSGHLKIWSHNQLYSHLFCFVFFFKMSFFFSLEPQISVVFLPCKRDVLDSAASTQCQVFQNSPLQSRSYLLQCQIKFPQANLMLLPPKKWGRYFVLSVLCASHCWWRKRSTLHSWRGKHTSSCKFMLSSSSQPMI